MEESDWIKDLKEATQTILDDLVIDVASKAVDDYYESKRFEEDACDYCRELGWRAPE